MFRVIRRLSPWLILLGLVTGSLTPWRLLGAVSILSEAIPNWQNDQIDAADLLDLGLNLAGVAVAACTFLMLGRLAEKLAPSIPWRGLPRGRNL